MSALPPQTNIPNARACAIALIRTARTRRDVRRLVDQFPGMEAEKIWLGWRIVAAVALVSVGYDNSAVRRALQLTAYQIPGEINLFPDAGKRRRCHAAIVALGREKLWAQNWSAG